MKRLYIILTFLLHYTLPIWLRWRLYLNKEDPLRFNQKIGIYDNEFEKGDNPVIVIHGASVGETFSALPLMDSLKEKYPNADIIFTSVTKTSGDLIDKKGISHFYSPIDSPQAVSNFFSYINPDIIFIMDSEVWPNYLFEAKKRGVKVFAVNMILSHRAIQRWKLVKGFFKNIIDCYNSFSVQNEETAIFIRSFTNKKININHNIKWAVKKSKIDKVKSDDYKKIISDKRVIVLLSTHENEEELLVHSLSKKNINNTLIVILPRHPHRAKYIERNLVNYTNILVINEMGVVPLWADLAGIVIMGFSFIKNGRGHNPIEPAIYNNVLISGKNTSSFTQVMDDFKKANAILEVGSPDEAAQKVADLLLDEKKAKEYSQNAMALHSKRQEHALGFLKEFNLGL